MRGYGKSKFSPNTAGTGRPAKAKQKKRPDKSIEAVRIRKLQAEQTLIELSGQNWPGFASAPSMNALARQVLEKKVIPYGSHRSILMLLQDMLDANKISFPRGKA